jgi:small subunit ribosomal protein S7
MVLRRQKLKNTLKLVTMRRRKAKRTPVLPDPKFNEVVVTKFVNNLMYDGKKNTAYKIFYDAIDTIEV